MGVNGEYLEYFEYKGEICHLFTFKLYCSILVATNPSVIDSRCTAKNC